MNPDQLQLYRKCLREEQDELSNEIKQHSDLGDLEVDTAVVCSEENLFEKIQRALGRIEQDSYGTCMG